jgi:hypothetical protein
MNRNLIVLLAAIVGVLLLFLWLGQDGKDEFSWAENYQLKSKQPYGTHVVHELLRGYLPTQKLVDLSKRPAQALPTDAAAATANYVFMGDGYLTDTADVDKILLFVHNGGRAFVSANAVMNYLMKRLSFTLCDTTTFHTGIDEFDEPLNKYHSFSYEYTDTVALRLAHPQLAENQPFHYSYLVKNKAQSYSWAYIDTLNTELDDCTEGGQNIAPLGNFDDEYLNFMRFSYGKGTFFMHTTPLAFTNVQLLDSARLRYATKALSHLQDGIIYWDEKSHASSDVVRNMNGSNIKLNRDSPLKFVLAQPALRWAWFVFLGLVVAYFLFMAKRRQRIVPILEEKKNTSLEFIQTIGLMYFRRHEHVRVCDMQIKQFQTYVRERYKLNSRDMNDTFVKDLAVRSNIVDADIRKITLFEKRIAYNDITEDAMIELHRLLTHFYKNCK